MSFVASMLNESVLKARTMAILELYDEMKAVRYGFEQLP